MINNLGTIYARVIRWNAARYERVYNHDLAMALLQEEYLEYLGANEAVDELDALCDLVYVAFGVLWKLNLGPEVFEEDSKTAHEWTVKLVGTNTLMPVYLISSVLNACDSDNETPVSLSMHVVISLALAQMSGLGLKSEECINALLVVCKANDTKKVVKVQPHVKANGNNKGIDFISPEPQLQRLLDIAEQRYANR